MSWIFFSPNLAFFELLYILAAIYTRLFKAFFTFFTPLFIVFSHYFMFPLHAQYLQNISMQFFIFILFVFIREMNNVYTSDEEEEEEERENLIQAKETREQTEKVEEEERNISRFPKYGWKVKLDHEFPEERDQNLRPSFGKKLNHGFSIFFYPYCCRCCLVYVLYMWSIMSLSLSLSMVFALSLSRSS